MNDEKKIKVLVSLPQIHFVQIETEIPENLYEMGGYEDHAKHIWSKLSEQEKDWTPNGLNGFQNFLEMGFSTIKKADWFL